MTQPIRIGEINTYSPSALSGFMATYKNGIDLVVDEINANGGVLGRPLEVVYRDDGLDKAQAAAAARSLLQQDGVDLIAGTFTSDVGMAVAEVADELKRVFIATEPRTDRLIWDRGSRYVFRIRTCQTMMVSMLATRVAQLPHKRWTVITPSYEGAKRVALVTREMMAKLRPDIVFAENIHFPLGGIDAETVDRLVATEPEAVLSIVYGSDLLPFVRMGRERGLFDKSLIVTPLGDPEYLDTLGDELPEGWLVLGYPVRDDKRPAHQAFVQAYRARFGVDPDAGALVGYMGFQAIAAGITRAGSTDTEALIAGFRGLSFESPIGPVRIRPGDHQATVGSWIGTTVLRDGRSSLTDWSFLDGEDHLPPEAEAAALRPAAARV
ncbi:MAG: ABC transporter substrate-binding protein [Burkholderiaceae bacterium]